MFEPSTQDLESSEVQLKKEGKCLTFILASEGCGREILKIRGILDYKGITDVPNTPDYNLQSGTQPFMDPIQISESCDSINDTLGDLMEDIDSRGLNYLGITQNSNAVWAEGYKSFGGNPAAEIHNNYGWGAPGRKDTLPGYNINDYFDYGGVAP